MDSLIKSKVIAQLRRVQVAAIKLKEKHDKKDSFEIIMAKTEVLSTEYRNLKELLPPQLNKLSSLSQHIGWISVWTITKKKPGACYDDVCKVCYDDIFKLEDQYIKYTLSNYLTNITKLFS